MQPIPNNLEVRVQHNGKRLILSIGVEGESEGNGWREWKPFLDCGGHSEKKQNAAKALLSSLAAKDAEIQKANYLLTRREKLIKKLGKKVQRLESANAALRELLGECYDDGLESHELRDRIDAALKEAGVSDV